MASDLFEALGAVVEGLGSLAEGAAAAVEGTANVVGAAVDIVAGSTLGELPQSDIPPGKKSTLRDDATDTESLTE